MKYLSILIVLLLFVCFTNKSPAQFSIEEQVQIDSLNLIINNPASHDTSRISAYVWLSEILYVSNIDTLMFLSKKAKNLADKALLSTNNKLEILSLKRSLGLAVNNIGYVLLYYGQTDECLEYYFESYKILEEIGDKPGVAQSLNNLSSVFLDQGQYEKSLEYNLKALKIREEIGDLYGMGYSLHKIGAFYANQDEFEKSMEYYLKALKIREEINDKIGIASTLNNLGIVYCNSNQKEKGLEYYFKSLDIRKETGDASGIALSLNNIGAQYYELGEFEKALENFVEALKTIESSGDKRGVSLSYLNIGSVYTNLGEISKGKEYVSKSYKLALELGYPIEIELVSRSLKEIALLQGNFEEAYELNQIEIKMRDSIRNDENYKASINLEAKYKYEKQATADSIVSAEAEKVHLANLEAEKAKGAQQETEIAAQKEQNIYLFVGLGLVALFGFFMYNRFKITQKQKDIIDEQKSEVEQQKIRAEKTLKELESTHIQLGLTHDQLEESHREITDSINYAERIQRSFLATKETLDENLKDYFVFFKPKEAVSGDFYWAAQLNNNNFAFTVADSTGHGVPGAIMSLLNITSLEKSVETETKPHKILNKTREIIVNRLSKDGSEHGGKDGMDCNLMVLNKDRSVLTFASANNTIIIIRNGEILEYKGDKMPVGKHDRDTESFTMHSVQLQKGDVIYALTDGFPDQFGGPKGKKYMIKNLKNKFLQIADMPMVKQEETLSKEFTTWMRENEQIDDVCIIGVRV